ncbi:MAG: hypothetical protein ACK54J_11440 [Pseudanabaena sp.]
MKFISILSLLMLNFCVFGATPVQALPGETPETITRKFNSSSFFKGLRLYQRYFPVAQKSVCCARRMTFFSLRNGNFLETSYTTHDSYTKDDVEKLNFKGSGTYKDYNFKYDFGVNLDEDIVFIEHISLDLNSQSSKYENKKYDYRKDSQITEVMNEVWGDDLITDFKNSRFTDVVIRSRSVTRQIYQGKKFAYEIIYSGIVNTSIIKHPIIKISVIIPEYIETVRGLSEFEERL